MKTNIDYVLRGLHQEFHQQHERTTLAAPNINNQLDDHSQHLEDEDEDPQQTTDRDKIDKVYDFYLAGQQSNTQSQQQQSQQQQSQQQQSQQQPLPQTSADTVRNGNYNH
jgi:hypothetical protein